MLATLRLKDRNYSVLYIYPKRKRAAKWPPCCLIAKVYLPLHRHPLELAVIQFSVEALFFQQFFVLALLNDIPILAIAYDRTRVERKAQVAAEAVQVGSRPSSAGQAAPAAGYAVAHVGSAAVGALAEKPELMGRVLVVVGLAEGIAIYGLVMSILLLDKI